MAALEWPLSLVVRVSPKSSVVIDASQIGFLQSDVDYSRTHDWYKPKDKPAGKIQHHMVVGENPQSVLFEATTFDTAQKVTIHNPKTLPVWGDCIDNIGQRLFDAELLRCGQFKQKSEIFTIFLGVTGQHGAMREGVKQIDLLQTTVSRIKYHFKDAVIFLKPHAFTHIDDVEQLIENEKWDRVITTFLHPSILSKNLP